MTTVLTDAEIMCVYLTSPSDILTGLRAVEAATLARGCCLCGGDVAKHNTYLSAVRRQRDERVPEREARRRERAAFMDGVRSELTWQRASMTGVADHDRVIADRDDRFPLPVTKRARTVTLSDGTTVNRAEINGTILYFHTWREYGLGGRTGSTITPFKLARTPADARALAELVERPFEDVADDA